VFKEETDPRIHITPACGPYDYFNEDTFSCEPCETMTRTYGIQNKHCEPCIWLRYSATDDLTYALLGQICREGFTKAILLATAFPFFLVLVACACCLTTAHYRSKGSMDETSTEEELEKKRIRTLVRKGIAVKFFRKNKDAEQDDPESGNIIETERKLNEDSEESEDIVDSEDEESAEQSS
jgi:hypothetical protein